MKHQVGEIHSNGKWVWTEYKEGKFDWRNIKKELSAIDAKIKKYVDSFCDSEIEAIEIFNASGDQIESTRKNLTAYMKRSYKELPKETEEQIDLRLKEIEQLKAKEEEGLTEPYKKVLEIVSVLTEDQQQLLRDTIIYGAWGDAECDFLTEEGTFEQHSMYGYCTNCAKEAKHFSGRKISAMFRSIYKKLCPERDNTTGRYISHCSDWWGDGSGDMLFIHSDYENEFIEWANKWFRGHAIYTF